MMLHPCQTAQKNTFKPAIKHCKHVSNGDKKNVLTIYTEGGKLEVVLKVVQIYASWSKIK